MRKTLPVTLGILMVVIGVIWTLQGLGYVKGSPMTGVELWAILGPLVAGLASPSPTSASVAPVDADPSAGRQGQRRVAQEVTGRRAWPPGHSAAASSVPCLIARFASSSAATSAPPMRCAVTPAATSRS